MRVGTTAGDRDVCDFRSAIIRGLAEDGSLFIPELPGPFPSERLEALIGLPFPEVASAVAHEFLQGEIDGEVLDGIIADAFDFPVPLSALGDDGTFLLELHHGPTKAFKDFGARFLARVLVALDPEAGETRTVLVATSGDTGGAVAGAFHGLSGMEVVVLYPHEQVSAYQRHQFTTLGGNVRAVAVHGTFDDCQRLVKEAFADGDLYRRLKLTSANSINLGRLIPQVFYHVYAWTALPSKLRDRPLVLSVPSGNFGNLTAAVIAKRLGVPFARLVAATNANDVVPQYLESGEYRSRPSIRTVSNAMDVGRPSNLARLDALYGGSVDRMRAEIEGSAHTDAETMAAIAGISRRWGRVVDPHTAVGWLGWEARRNPGEVGVIAATADPIKFAGVIADALDVDGWPPQRSEGMVEGPHRREAGLGVRTPPGIETLIHLEDPVLVELSNALGWS